MSRKSTTGQVPGLHIETLEGRDCPSTTVLFDNAAHPLTITGHNKANVDKVVHNDNANEVHVLHDGQDEVFSSSAIDKIVVDLKGGNDSFTQTLQEGTNFFRGKSLDVNTGAGRDKVLIDLAGNANHWAILKE